MMNWKNNFNYRLNLMGVTEKLILVNIFVFAVFIVLKLFAFLFDTAAIAFVPKRLLILPSEIHSFVFKPWTLITYAFMHEGFLHLLWNMVILFFSSRLFLTFFSSKKLLNYYFLGAIAGAVFFMASYNLFPVFSGGKPPLLGASAAVMAILVGVATKAPEMRVRLFILGNIKLWWIAAFFVGQDLIMMPVSNAGGHLAHLGGAALGFFYTKQLNKGYDIGLWFEKIMDNLVGMFSSKKKKPFRKVYKNAAGTTVRKGPYKEKSSKNMRSTSDLKNKQDQIDAILDKISKNGYESLTKAEKDFLFNAGKD